MGETNFTSTEPIINEEYFEDDDFHPEFDYEFRVVSVDGAYETPSEIQNFRVLRLSSSK